MLRHPKGVNLITTQGGTEQNQHCRKSLQLLLKKKCNTNKDIEQNNPVFNYHTPPILIRLLGHNLLFCNLVHFLSSITQLYENSNLWSNTDLFITLKICWWRYLKIKMYIEGKKILEKVMMDCGPVMVLLSHVCFKKVMFVLKIILIIWWTSTEWPVSIKQPLCWYSEGGRLMGVQLYYC